MVEVPSADAAAAEMDAREGYAVAGLDTARAERVSMLLEEQEGEVAKFKRPVIAYSERPTLPPHPMINGVFTFLLQPGTILWATALSIGVTILLTLLAMALGAGRVEGPATWISSMLLTGVLSCSTLAWLVVASGFFLCVLQDSAAGNARIENWPDVVWLDWIGDSLYLITNIAGSAAIGYGVAWLCGGASGPLTLLFITLFLYLLFPIMLLSTLEMQSPLLPLSPTILRSTITSWKTWAVFYLETVPLGLIILGPPLAVLLAWLTLPNESTWLMVLASYVMARLIRDTYLMLLASCMIGILMVVAQLTYFRLLGRLAWVCAEDQRALDAEEEEEDEEEEDESPPDIRPTPVDDF
jgi:hypothetical protein